MRSIWEHLWTFYLIPLFFAINSISWNTTWKYDAGPLQLSAHSQQLLHGKQSVPPKRHYQCHAPTSGVRVEKIKPGLLLSAYSACAEDTRIWLLFGTPQNKQNKGMTWPRYWAVSPGRGWGPPWNSVMRKGEHWSLLDSGPKSLDTKNLISWLYTN